MLLRIYYIYIRGLEDLLEGRAAKMLYSLLYSGEVGNRQKFLLHYGAYGSALHRLFAHGLYYKTKSPLMQQSKGFSNGLNLCLLLSLQSCIVACLVARIIASVVSGLKTRVRRCCRRLLLLLRRH